MDISALLGRFETMTETARVLVKKGDGPPVLEEAGLLGTLGAGAGNPETLLRLLLEAVADEAGQSAAQECEQRLRALLAAQKGLTAGQCRDALRPYALRSSDAAALQKFLEEIPEDLRSSLRVEACSPYGQLAVMQGVRKGLDLMQALAGLAGEEEAFGEKASGLELESVQKAQKTLAGFLKKWVAAMLEPLPEAIREQELPLVKKSVFMLLLSRHEEAANPFLDSMTAGILADIATLQGAAVRSFTRFGEEARLPQGIDVKGPAFTQTILREFLFVAACRRIKKQSGLAKQEAIRAKATQTLRSDPVAAMSRLLTLYLNSLLQDLPAEKELRPRASVKGFDAEGFHADFVRDCIAKRCSFTIENHGKLENAFEREAIVGRGRKDLEFYETQLAKMLEEGREQEVKKWAPPQVRASPAMTEKDLKSAKELGMRAIPDRGMRMAVTRVSNQAALGLLEAFFCKDPAMGVNFVSTDKEMFFHFAPRKGAFSVEARVHNGSLKSLERSEEGEDELDLGWVSFFQLEYTGVLHKPGDPNNASGVFKRVTASEHPQAARWLVSDVTVASLAANLVPPMDPDDSENH